jgi:hypothetical protein
VLLLNVNISASAGAPIEFPASDEVVPDEHGRLLFSISSPLPSSMRAGIEFEGVELSDGARGFTFQGDAVAIIRFLDIGTRPSTAASRDAR